MTTAGFSPDTRITLAHRLSLHVRALLCGITVLLALAAAQQPVVAQCPSLRPQDSFWQVSTRHLGCPAVGEPDLDIRRYDDGWSHSDMAEFLAAGGVGEVTCIFVHAARADSSVTMSRGIQFYHSLTRRTEGPVRFVVWSWPSPKTGHVLRDFRVSYQLLDRHAYYLGWFLTQMPVDAQVSLIGFSMGAAIIAGGIHAAAGGSLAGQELPGDTGPQQMRVVLWSASFHNYWLLPHSHYGRAMSRIDHLYLLINTLDPVLKRYRLVERCSHAAAIGYTGLAGGRQMGSDRDRISQVNGCRWLGRHHDYDRHAQSAAILGPSLRCLLWHPFGENP